MRKTKDPAARTERSEAARQRSLWALELAGRNKHCRDAGDGEDVDILYTVHLRLRDYGRDRNGIKGQESRDRQQETSSQETGACTAWHRIRSGIAAVGPEYPNRASTGWSIGAINRERLSSRLACSLNPAALRPHTRRLKQLACSRNETRDGRRETQAWHDPDARRRAPRELAQTPVDGLARRGWFLGDGLSGRQGHRCWEPKMLTVSRWGLSLNTLI
ncbi:hypothetical protein MGYG_04257 [Nannizzia gypsea CBS 118893]|uniref:Uncharacterized protein n=1 Tax=Arthroderma gypseum (strain ATCC MYA-4604 / CBS 118893) TaxID=535722 RepID=E4URZ5_ARTGP|nr:hypothetical protein MGYG_04257 [Nannizzia gypsea CBS 118893]EFR01252.1 hypothetical protein MGYG_04257 [Nannizzia gypsea CBS 118893]